MSGPCSVATVSIDKPMAVVGGKCLVLRSAAGECPNGPVRPVAATDSAAVVPT